MDVVMSFRFIKYMIFHCQVYPAQGEPCLTNNHADSTKNKMCCHITLVCLGHLQTTYISESQPMPGNIAGNTCPKFLSVLPSHCIECLQVIKNETLSSRFLSLET